MGVSGRSGTLAMAGSLVAVLVGHRVFPDLLAARLTLVLGGLALALAVAARSGLRWRASASGLERRVAGGLALAQVGCAVALLGFLAGTEDGVRLLGIDLAPLAELRLRRGLLVGSATLLAASLTPALAAWWAVRSHGGTGEGARRVAAIRVLDVSTSWLSTALAGAFLMIGGYVASAHDRTLDASYFKTSSPGSAVQELVATLRSPLRVLLFFPEVDPVKDELTGYFRALAGATGNVDVEAYDRLAQPGAAAEHDVTEDGTVILLHEDRRERFGVPTDLSAARRTLRVVDEVVQRTLLALRRERIVAYLTVGHGELADPLRSGSGPTSGPTLQVLRGLLDGLGYEVRDLGQRTGLLDRVPQDAATLLVIGPERPFHPSELRVVEEYLAGGGSLLLALDPESAFELGSLRERLGVDFRPVPLADEQRYIRQRGGPSDRRLIVTSRFAAHPSVATGRRGGVGSGILLAGAGHLVEVEGAAGVRTQVVIESMPSTFADVDGDYRFDPERDLRGGFGLAVAVEGEAGAGPPMRGIVYADADLFSDAVLGSLGMNAAVVADAVRWLGREERFAGEVVSEADVPIVHTNAENVAWFYAIILGAPGIVLGIGFARLVRPRKARSRES